MAEKGLTLFNQEGKGLSDIPRTWYSITQNPNYGVISQTSESSSKARLSYSGYATTPTLVHVPHFKKEEEVELKDCFCICRQQAMETFLPYENKVSEFLVASGMSIICFLVFRAVTQKPLQFFLDNKDKFTNHDETAGSNKEKVEILVASREQT